MVTAEQGQSTPRDAGTSALLVSMEFGAPCPWAVAFTLTVWGLSAVSRNREASYTGFERLPSSPPSTCVCTHACADTPGRPMRTHRHTCRALSRGPHGAGLGGQEWGLPRHPERWAERQTAREHARVWRGPCGSWESADTQPRRQDVASRWWPHSWWRASSQRTPRRVSAGMAPGCQPWGTLWKWGHRGQGQMEGEDRCRGGGSLGRGWAQERRDPRLRRQIRRKVQQPVGNERLRRKENLGRGWGGETDRD